MVSAVIDLFFEKTWCALLSLILNNSHLLFDALCDRYTFDLYTPFNARFLAAIEAITFYGISWQNLSVWFQSQPNSCFIFLFIKYELWMLQFFVFVAFVFSLNTWQVQWEIRKLLPLCFIKSRNSKTKTLKWKPTHTKKKQFGMFEIPDSETILPK